MLFGNPEREAPVLSPDGQQLLYLAPVQGVLNVWVGPADRPDQARPITRDASRGIRVALWSAGGERVLYLQDRDGKENWRLYAVDPATAKEIDLSSGPNARTLPAQLSYRRPHEVVVIANDRDPAWHDVYSIDVRTAKRRLLFKNDQRLSWFLIDDDLEVRGGVRGTADGGMEMLAPRGKRWQQLLAVGLVDERTTEPGSIDADGHTLYLKDSRGRETAALVARDLETGQERVLAEHPKAGISDWIEDHETHRPLAVSFTHLRQEWQALDKTIEADLTELRAVADGELAVVSQSRDGKRWVVQYRVDDGPARYYLYDRNDRRAKLLFTADAELAAHQLAKMRPVVIRARDGLELVSYYTLPVGADPDGDGLPNAPLPTVLVVHGGPWERDTWGFSPHHQWLASRGYAVLSVNFRGSSGFTKSFINAGDHEMGGKMHDDLLDAVAWMVEQRIADPERVAIMGGSYGGYATLVGLTVTPETFACGVDLVGPSNLETLLASVPPYWVATGLRFKARWGDLDTEEGRALLRERSPLHRVEAIKRPLLIGQGANDPRVTQQESDQIVAAMQARGLPVTYVLYPDEGHGFGRPENAISFNAITEAFLARCLGGPYQPIGDDFKNASLIVKTGAEHVPGLNDALRAAGKP
ncbi:S9 family peptidase [Nannocystis punicea]|uniref:S9 family peptidase n=1 Tax=Nannocystis punicea TaxID=2995304 RepID=A0ABY7GSK8_9BACT|nr:S9 family peptidase [Nannocystis poenicansa]WAS89912.1 S9 family peptidase [Nannocystis poenicansa]